MRAESQLQRACVRWFRIQHRNHASLLFAIPNGARLQGTKTERGRQWAALALEGATAGAPDLFLAIPGKATHGLFLEIKTKSGRQTPEQKNFEALATAQGYAYFVPRSLDEFIKTVTDHMESTAQF